MKHFSKFRLPCTHQTVLRDMLHFFLFHFLFLGYLSGQQVADASLNVTTKQSIGTMPGALNGIARNHFIGYCDDPALSGDEWKETQRLEKLDLFGGIQHKFANAGKRMYRIGHNISDGNAEYGYFSANMTHPGWHWATEYKTGFDQEMWVLGDPNHSNSGNKMMSGLCDGSEPIFAKIGAGIHRFMFALPQATYPYVDQCMGYTVNINYPNSITFQKVPKSHSLVFGASLPNLRDSFQVSAGVGLNVQIQQIGGPLPGTVLPVGSYELDFRILATDPTDIDRVEMSYYGVVVSIIGSNPSKKLVRTMGDTLMVLNVNKPGSIREKHREQFQLIYPRAITSSFNAGAIQFATYSDSKGNVYPIATNSGLQSLEKACQARPFGYDDITVALEEAKRINADLSICINISTGFPEEAKALVDYINSEYPQVKVKIIELGSELMGYWNKNTPQSPQGLARLTRPFARHLKANFGTDQLKIATTSTYNFWTSFDNNGGLNNPQDIVRIWLSGLAAKNGSPLIDLLNIHTYPNNGTAAMQFDQAKARSLLSIADQMDSVYMPIYRRAIGQAFSSDSARIGFIITESNTGGDTECTFTTSLDTTINGTDTILYIHNNFTNTPPNHKQNLTMTEAMYYGDLFALSAKQNFDAYIPFALLKPQTHYGDFNVPNGNPYDPASFIADNPEFNILFYPNNAGSTPLPYGNQIFTKPAFKAKKLIAENLGTRKLNYVSTEQLNHLSMAAFVGWRGGDSCMAQGVQPTTYRSLQILPTLTNDSVFTMVINRRLPGTGNSLLDYRIDSTKAQNVQVLSMIGMSIFDKNPIIRTTNYTLTPDAPFIPLEPFAIHFIKSGIQKPPLCTTITAPTNDQQDISTTPTITWAAAQFATGYTLTIDTTAGSNNLGNYTLGNVNTFTLPIALPPCQEVFFTITPFNAIGQAQNCPSVMAKTACCIGCGNLTISTNTTWSQPNGAQSYGTITVRNNSTLTIPSANIISFCPSGSLVIEPGSAVLLSGTLTSCSDSWLGVVVQDLLNTGSTTPKRGQITGYTGARIENAQVGIKSWHGSVVCTGVQFVNNAVDYLSAKKVLPSQTPTPSGYFGGINRFTNCNFTVNDNYKNPIPFTAHVKLVGAVNRSLFNNCKWNTAMVNKPVPDINYGIQAAASYVNVYGINTKFDGLAYGLYTTNNQRPPANQEPFGAGYLDTRANVTDASFDHCAVGIFDRTATGNNYVRNSFKYGRIPAPYLTLFVKNTQNPLDDPNYGAQLGISSETNVFGFTLKDNQFYGQTHPTNTSNAIPNIRTSVGTNMVQIGGNENIVFRNKFYHLTHANISLGSNANLSGNTGLRYECNELTLNTRYDVLALDYTNLNPDPTVILPLPIARLKKNQGKPDTLNPGIYFPATNCFTDKNNLPLGYVSHFWYTNPAKLNYWYDANIACHKPEVNLLNVAGFPTVGASNECNDIIVIGEGESKLPQGLTWSPEQTNTNRAEYFASVETLENAQGEEVPFYQAKLNDLARLGYLSAIQEEQPFDSVLVWLRRMNTYESYLTLANEYANRAQNDQAFTTLQYIQNHFEEANALDIENLSQIWSTLSTPTDQLSKVTIALLVGIAEQETLYSSSVARSILVAEGLAHYPPILQIETGVSERSAQFKTEPKVQLLSAEPNPAVDQVRIGINMIDTHTQACIIVISDTKGTVVNTQTLAKGQNSFVWHTNHLATGIYFARLLVDDNHRDELKIVIQR
jgi:Secretion system C-terminal sorting domain